MRERTRRLRAIKEIIQNNPIESQEQILVHLKDDGIRITQATLSRDLKLLNVVKASGAGGGSFYSLPPEELRRERQASYRRDFQRGYVSLSFSIPLAVIRTLHGHADSVAIALDHMNIPDVLGTVAGDDTVFVALREGIQKENFLEQLRERIPEFAEFEL